MSRCREFEDDRKEVEVACQKHKELANAITEFIKILAKNDIDHNGMISKEEFKKAMSAVSLTLLVFCFPALLVEEFNER